MRTRLCGRCGDTFTRSKRDPDVWCGACSRATEDATLYALLFDDRTAIYSLHEEWPAATAAMKEDAQTLNMSRLIMIRVTGQSGARSELNRYDDQDEADRRYDAAHFEHSQRMHR